MGFADLFKATENEALRARIAELEALLTPEILEAGSIAKEIQQKKAELVEIIRRCEAREIELKSINSEIEEAKEELIITEEEVLMQSFGLYTPKFEFASSSKYKLELDSVRKEQKDLIKAGKAITGKTDWTVDGSATKGRKLVNDMQKLLLRAFNTECDDIVQRVKFNNFDASLKRIEKSCNSISNLGSCFGIKISDEYCFRKMNEVVLAYEYQQAKQMEKDQLKQLRAEERERAKLEKEILEARKKIEKEQKHYTNALAKINQQIQTANPDELSALEEKKAELEDTLKELGKSIEQIDYRAANQKAGYVYIISNIGAFGEGIYKIGMTRRLEPMDRIDELGDASVPFDFDVHAMIFSDNAPALEAALHHAFEDRKVNMINTRREFFRVSLDEIKEVIQKNYDKTVEFFDIPPAEQFRQSELMRSSK